MHFNINRILEHPNVEADSCMAVRNNSLLNDELNSDCIIQHSINEIEMNFQYLEALIVKYCLQMCLTRKQSRL